MKVTHRFKLVLAIMLTLSFMGCSKKIKDADESLPVSEVNSVCETADCLSDIDWKIYLQGQLFPEKIKLLINGQTMINECAGKREEYSVDRDSAPQTIWIPRYFVPKAGHLKILVKDLGWNCNQSKVFLVNDNVDFEIEKSDTSSELVIRL